MAKTDFAKQVGEFVAKSEGRMTAVFRASAQDVIKEAQRPRAKGGNMRVDTGWLVNSGIAELNTIPSGEADKPKDYNNPTWNPQPMILVINKAKLGDRVIFGWVARYSRPREAKDGFLRLAAQQWPEIVRRNARALRQRISR